MAGGFLCVHELRGASARERTSKARCRAVGGLILAGLFLGAAAPASATGLWSAPVPLSPTVGGPAHSSAVAVSADGSAVTAWIQEAPSPTRVWAAVYTPEGGWAQAVPVQTTLAGLPQQTPLVAIDAQGNALVVWSQPGASILWELRAATFTAGVGWGADQRVYETGDATMADADLTLNGAGQGAVVFVELNGPFANVVALRYAPATGWSGRERVSGGATNCSEPSVGIDEAGALVAVWTEDGTAHLSAAANRYVPGSGWGTARLIETNSAGDVGVTSVAVAPAGNAFAVWQQNDGVSWSAWANRFVPGSGWGSAGALETRDDGIANWEKVAATPSGGAVAVWWWDNGSAIDVQSSVYTAGSGWGPVATVDRGDGAAVFPEVAVGGDGTAYIVWQGEGAAGYDIFAAMRPAGGNWTQPMILDRDFESGGSRPSIGAGAGAGGAVASWHQLNITGVPSVWAAAFKAPDASAPALSLSAPAEGASFGTPMVRVAGTTEPGSSVSVDGDAAAVSAQGAFSLTVSIGPGSNRVTVTAVDAAGNSATAWVNVTYADPVPALQAALAAAQALANLTAGQLANVQIQLTQAAADAASARASANATAAQLVTAQSALATTQGQLASTQTTFNQTRASSAPSADTTVPLLVALAAMALGAGGLVVGMRSAAAVSRVGTSASKPPEERKPPA